jgi:hypothetical protein
MFALYDKLLNDIKNANRPITDQDADQFVNNVPKLTPENKELCFAIIRNYQIKNDSAGTFIIPYGGKHLKKGIRFNFEEFPEPLKKLLIEFNKNIM